MNIPPKRTKADPTNTAKNKVTITNNVIMKRITLKKQNKVIKAIIVATSIDNKNDNEPMLVRYRVDSIIRYLLLVVEMLN